MSPESFFETALALCSVRLWDLQTRRVAQRYVGHFQAAKMVAATMSSPNLFVDPEVFWELAILSKETGSR